MAVTIAKILKILNMEGTEFEDGVIEMHIETASAIVDAKNKLKLKNPIVEVAKLRLAAYLAYLSYADAPENHLPGQIDPQSGAWKPISDAPVRETQTKLSAMKKAADEALEALEELNDTTEKHYGVAFGTLHIK